MFGNRCLGLSGCGHSTNWTCACTCDEEIAKTDSSGAPVAQVVAAPKLTEIDRLNTQIEGMARYVQHDTGCDANDFDYLDRTPCTCGLRAIYDPKGLGNDQ